MSVLFRSCELLLPPTGQKLPSTLRKVIHFHSYCFSYWSCGPPARSLQDVLHYLQPALAHLFITANPISFQIPLPHIRHHELYIQTGFISVAFPPRCRGPAWLITCHFLQSHNSIRLTRQTHHSRLVTQSHPSPFSSLADKRQ